MKAALRKKERRRIPSAFWGKNIPRAAKPPKKITQLSLQVWLGLTIRPLVHAGGCHSLG